MSLPVIETPSQLKKYLNDYRSIFTKPQFNHFSNLITGTIVSDNKTIQEINDCFAEKDQSNLNRFVNSSDWDEEEADKEHPFKTAREIGIEQLKYATSKDISYWLVMADAGLYADFLIEEIKSLNKKYIIGIRITNKISIDREKRISINEYLETITDLDFSKHIIGEDVYHLHTKEIYTRGIGKEKLLISYKDGDEDVIKIYTTNVLDKCDEEMMEILLERWEIETLHRDAKQHLGLEDYQLRKFGGIQKVVLAVLVAYTLLALCMHQKILEPLGRAIKTIGEGCRFFRLVAMK